MSSPAHRPATYADLLKVPDRFVAEIVDGELYANPRPAFRTQSLDYLEPQEPFEGFLMVSLKILRYAAPRYTQFVPRAAKERAEVALLAISIGRHRDRRPRRLLFA